MELHLWQVKKIEVYMEVMMLRLTMEIIITTVTMSMRMVNFKGALQLETMDTTYPTWNQIYSTVDIPRINSKIPFFVHDDGPATIVTWLLS